MMLSSGMRGSPDEIVRVLRLFSIVDLPLGGDIDIGKERGNDWRVNFIDRGEEC